MGSLQKLGATFRPGAMSLYQKIIVWTSGMPTAIQLWCLIEDPCLNEKDGIFARP